MANPYRCERALEVDGRKYDLQFDWNSAAEYELAARETIARTLQNIASGEISAVALRAMLWSGMRANHREVTIEQAGEMIARVGRVPVVRLLSDAIRYYFPELAKDEPAADPPSPPPST